MNELTEVAIQNYRIHEAAAGVVNQEWDFKGVVEEEGDVLCRMVMGGSMTVKDLRAGLSYASALDAEACHRVGSDLSVGPQRIERTARRIMHHAGKVALEDVGSARSRTNLYVRQRTGL